MLKKVILFAAILQSGIGNIHAAERGKNFMMKSSDSRHIFINNRILAKVNGKAISVIDLMKKMDLIFYRRFPEYASSVEARYQFYNVNWKHFLTEMIEKELILGDAEEVKIEVSHGDIRQEMENMFGPNIIANLDKAGLSYEDAWSIVKEDQILKRTMGARVNSKAVRSITPSDIRQAYEENKESLSKPDTWRYQIISLKGNDKELLAIAGNHTYELAAKDGVPIENLGKKIEEHSFFGTSGASYTISEEYIGTSKELSEAYREILSQLAPNSYSAPTMHKAKSGDGQVVRIFFLKEYVPGGPPPLAGVEAKLKSMLIEKMIDKESEVYLKKLKQHFDVQGDENNPLYPEDFHPFELK